MKNRVENRTQCRFWLIESILFGVTAGDPWSMSGAAVILLTAALTAGFVPARRASKIDPMTAVRCD